MTLGQLELYLGHSDRALSVFRDAVRLAPESAAARTGLTASLLGLGRYQDAASKAREALALADGADLDDRRRLRRNLGAALLWLGKGESAVQIMRAGAGGPGVESACALATALNWLGADQEAASACGEGLEAGRHCECVGRASEKGPPAQMVPEEAAVVAAVLADSDSLLPALGDHVVIEAQTILPGTNATPLAREAIRYELRRAALLRSEQCRDAVDAMFTNSEVPAIFGRPTARGPRKVEVLSSDQLAQLARGRPQSFAARYPGSRGIALVTRPGLSKDRGVAAIAVQVYGPGLPDDFAVFFLSRDGAAWRVVPDELRVGR